MSHMDKFVSLGNTMGGLNNYYSYRNLTFQCLLPITFRLPVQKKNAAEEYNNITDKRQYYSRIEENTPTKGA